MNCCMGSPLSLMKCTLALALLLASSLIALQGETIAGKRPNIIFILTDDQGYGDISAHGNPVLKTPNLDRLHDEGVRFTDFHVSPTCAPTRSALMTGRHEFKNGVTHTILERERLTLKATTIVELLKASGYATGIFGKWHLGDEADYQPGRRGFEEVFIHGGGGIGQMYPGSCGDAPGNSYFNPAILHNGKFEQSKGYCTDVFFDRATQWIDSQQQMKKPFLAWISPNAPHTPLLVKPEDKAVYEGKGLTVNEEAYFGMIHNIDSNVGELLARLQAWGIAKDTLVVFMSDNGGTVGTKLYNADMRGAKGTAWLGGTRASSFWRWPGTLQPGDCGALTAHVDFFRTMSEIAGVKIPDEVKPQVEGRSLVPLLENPKAAWEERHLFSHQGRWQKFTDANEAKYRMGAVRSSNWALISADGAREPKWQLFDLKSDYAQKNNVISEHPQVVRELSAAYEQWWAECVPMFVNDTVAGPDINPFQALYYQQYGGQPGAEDAARMKWNPYFENVRAGKARRKE